MSASYQELCDPPPGRAAVAGKAQRAGTRANDSAVHHFSKLPDPVASFRAAARDHGIELPNALRVDGHVARFPTGNRSCDRSGWYVLHLGSEPHGAFGDWRRGLTVGWCARGRDREIAPAERQRIRQELDQQRRLQVQETEHRQHVAALRARALWAQCEEPAPLHGYLQAKRLQAVGVRQLGRQLLVPLFDGAGVLWSVQTIDPDGSKRFLQGGRKRGMYAPLAWIPGEPVAELLIAEGWGTACAAHLLFGLPAVAAMDCGNLLPVAQAIRSRYPLAALTFAADHDGPGGGIGVEKASAAAHLVGNARVIRPDCADDARADFADVWLQAQRGAL